MEVAPGGVAGRPGLADLLAGRNLRVPADEAASAEVHVDVLALVTAADADAVPVRVADGHREAVLDLGERGRVVLRRQMREQAEGADQGERPDRGERDAEGGLEEKFRSS